MLQQMWESALRQTLQVHATSDTQKSSYWPEWCCTLWRDINSCLLSDIMSFQMVRQLDCQYVKLYFQGSISCIKFLFNEAENGKAHCFMGARQVGLSGRFCFILEVLYLILWVAAISSVRSQWYSHISLQLLSSVQPTVHGTYNCPHIHDKILCSEMFPLVCTILFFQLLKLLYDL